MTGALAEFIDRRPSEVLRDRDGRDDRDGSAVDPAASISERPEAWPGGIQIGAYADTSLAVPGKSDQPARCETWEPREFCTSCGEVHFGPHMCQQRECPVCWLTWRAKRAAAITERLAAARRAADGAGKRLVHVVASPPPPEEGGSYSLLDFEQDKRRAYDLAKEKGVRGGAVLPHPWRVKEEVKKAHRQAIELDLFDGGVWQFVREHPREWRTLTTFSPHFHILGLSEDVGESDPEDDDGWVFHRVSHDGNSAFPSFSLTDSESYKPMFSAAMYLLSHVGFNPNDSKQVVRWYGSLANNQFSAESALEEWELSVLRRKVAEVSEQSIEEGGDGAGEEARECPSEGCGGVLTPIWNAPRYLTDPEWCDGIGREQEARLSAVFDWAVGERHPPPGLKHPSDDQECEDVVEAIL